MTERWPLLFCHIGVSVDAAVRSEVQCAKVLLGSMIGGKHKVLGLLDGLATGRANATFLGILYFTLQDEKKDPT